MEFQPEVVDRFNLAGISLSRATVPTSDLLSLDGQYALVTGGGGSGLGNAICHRLAEQGAAVGVLDASMNAAEIAAEELRSRWGVSSIAITADVGDWHQVQIAVDEASQAFGKVDILVNNAGGPLDRGYDFASAPYHQIEATVSLNLFGVLNVTKAVLGLMLPAHKGRIINISSEGGKVGGVASLVYSTAKAAVIAFTRNLAHEVGPSGISVVTVCPGIMVGSQTLDGFRGADLGSLENLVHGFDRATIGRCSTPDEVASVVSFLASEAGAYIHGTAVSVGGGMSD